MKIQIQSIFGSLLFEGDFENISKAVCTALKSGSDFELPTKMVYENLNLRLTRGKNNYSIPRFLKMGDIIRELHNDLESVSLEMHPELADLKKILLRHGALGALMSGSGPTVFGIFRDGKEAKKILEVIKKEVSDHSMVFFAKSL